jgi:hypothetical protein
MIHEHTMVYLGLEWRIFGSSPGDVERFYMIMNIFSNGLSTLLRGYYSTSDS